MRTQHKCKYRFVHARADIQRLPGLRGSNTGIEKKNEVSSKETRTNNKMKKMMFVPQIASEKPPTNNEAEKKSAVLDTTKQIQQP